MEYPSFPDMMPPDPKEQCSDRELMLEILKSIAKLEGILLAQSQAAKPASLNQSVGMWPVPSSQLDMPPSPF